MKRTDQTLLEQMRFTEFETEYRKTLFGLTETDIQLLRLVRPSIEDKLDSLVAQFYEMQTGIPEIALLIGDADTLERLRNAQRRYIIDLFSGLYDLEYVNNRLRIGLVHKRIGVEPKLYLSGIYTLKNLLNDCLHREIADAEQSRGAIAALEKLLMFDITLVFDTYIRSLLAEIEISAEKSARYASALEEKVIERTRQLEELSRTDPLTGLLNVRHLLEILTRTLRAAQRREEPVSLVYIDLNDFKLINDNHGHQRGDDILRRVGLALTRISRREDSCFRYGGDEFCVILPNCNAAAARELYCERLRQELADDLPDLQLSIGVAQAGPTHYPGPEALIHQADERMYAEKRSRREALEGGEAEAASKVAVIEGLNRQDARR